MKQFYVILIAIFVFGLFGILSWQRSLHKTGTQKNSQTAIETSETSKSELSANQKYINELLEQQVPFTCTFSQKLPGAVIAGTAYFNKNQARVDISAPDKNGVAKTSHTIIDGDTMYTWYDKESFGLKQTDNKASGPDNPETPQKFLELASTSQILGGIDAQCEKWNLDKFVFSAPLEVKFLELAKYNEEINKRLCMRCDQETTEASRLLCRKMIKCDQ